MKIVRKSLSSIKNQGIRVFNKRVKNYIGTKLVKSAGLCEVQPIGSLKVAVEEPIVEEPIVEEPVLVRTKMVDVLFINGCGAAVPHPARYRVSHQIEQLSAGNVTCDEVYYEQLQLEQVKSAHLFVFFRCPYTDIIGQFIALAKLLNKTVLFDIDDLVIDTRYTDQVKYVKSLIEAERELYDNGVERMGRTLKLCEGAITTTECLANELSHYVDEVYINRNTASERMYELSENAIKNRNDKEVRIGYFSGSITHNDDFLLVLPTIVSLLKKYENLRLYIVGELSLPDELKECESQIVVFPFMSWEELPQLIASVDINIAPLEDSIFNEAKSENKWIEAALVKVVTVASDVGAFKKMIQHGETGYLCGDTQTWINTLEMLINDADKRKKIADKAYSYVKENCLTIYTSHQICNYIKSKMRPSLALILPSTEISGGIMVALKHAMYIQDVGYEVTIIASNPSLKWMEFENHKFPVLYQETTDVYAYFDKAIATMWSTTPFIQVHPAIGKRYYLVQGYEIDFYAPNVPLRIQASQTYSLGREIQYNTISKWCKRWLKQKYEIDARYAPDGINTEHFYSVERDFSGKIRILIEGDCAVDYKRIDESFEIANQLDRDKYEIWYMSYNEEPKDWYNIDKFLHRVPYAEVPDVYRQCHILLKSSILESFSYPPIEMMSTGGYVVVVKNDGNSEYLRDGENCMIYNSGNVGEALSQIYRIVDDSVLRKVLLKNAKTTAKKYEWDNIKQDILSMYDIK